MGRELPGILMSQGRPMETVTQGSSGGTVEVSYQVRFSVVIVPPLISHDVTY
jgi:hypothetical protein